MTGRTADWVERLLEGDRAALGRAISWVENEAAELTELLPAVQPLLGRARVVGFTGPPGVGKSTLVAAYVAELRERGRRVGVIAVDPSSPRSGGAILGDRIRMSAHSGDPGVFVRSIAARGHLGGLSLTTSRVVDVMDAAGNDDIVLETVGTGQSEIEVADVAGTTVVVYAPGFGDDVQAAKAGVLEVADIVVVNKSDLSHAERLMLELRRALALASRDPKPPVLACVAVEGGGVEELVDTVEAHARGTRGDPRSLERTRRLVARVAGARLEARVRSANDDGLLSLCRAVGSGELGLDAAAERIVGGALAAGSADQKPRGEGA